MHRTKKSLFCDQFNCHTDVLQIIDGVLAESLQKNEGDAQNSKLQQLNSIITNS